MPGLRPNSDRPTDGPRAPRPPGQGSARLRLVRPDDEPRETTRPASRPSLRGWPRRHPAETAPDPSTPSAYKPLIGQVQALQGATDPRWVLALRTAEQLQGAILTPEARQQLVRVGKLLGLTPFDANLVIAIVQDRARRGHPPDQCPAASHDQLALVPLPRRRRFADALPANRWLRIAWIIAAILGLELLLLWWLL